MERKFVWVGEWEQPSENTKKYFKKIQELYKDHKFVDVEIKCGETRIFVHKIILAAAVPFAREFFIDNPDKQQMKIEELTMEEILPKIVDFIYTGYVKVEEDLIFDFYSAADYLQMEDLCKICENLLIRMTNINNCVDHLNFSKWKNISKLYRSSRKFILLNFEEIVQFSKESQHLLKLDLPSFKDLLSSNKLSISSEEQLFHVVMDWLAYVSTRSGHLVELTALVRMELFRREFLTSILDRYPVCKGNPHFLSKLFNVLRSKDFSPEKRGKIRNPRYGAGRIYMIRTNGAGEQHFQSCARDLTDLTSHATPPDHRKSFALCFLEGDLYMTGGSTSFDHNYEIGSIDHVTRYSPAFDAWFPAENMKKERRRHASCCLGNRMYVMGGINDVTYMTSCESFHPDEGWERIGKMRVPRSDAACTSFRDRIWICGGASGDFGDTRTLSSVEVYNPKDDVWCLVSEEMRVGRSGQFLSSFHGRLVILGGIGVVDCEIFRDDQEELKKMQIDEMSDWRMKSVKCGGRIYVFHMKEDEEDDEGRVEKLGEDGRWIIQPHTLVLEGTSLDFASIS